MELLPPAQLAAAVVIRDTGRDGRTMRSGSTACLSDAGAPAADDADRSSVRQFACTSQDSRRLCTRPPRASTCQDGCQGRAAIASMPEAGTVASDVAGATRQSVSKPVAATGHPSSRPAGQPHPVVGGLADTVIFDNHRGRPFGAQNILERRQPGSMKHACPATCGCRTPDNGSRRVNPRQNAAKQRHGKAGQRAVMSRTSAQHMHPAKRQPASAESSESTPSGRRAAVSCPSSAATSRRSWQKCRWRACGSRCSLYPSDYFC